MTMPLLGRYALVLAGLGALYVTGFGWWANRRRDLRAQESVRGAAVAVAVSLTTAVLVLEYLLVTGDFAVQAVFNHTNRALPIGYRMAALWGGDSGSVLFWGWILSLYTAWVAWRGWPREGQMTPMVVPLLGGLLLFFTGLSNFVANPFRLVPGHPTDGSGLDPLLQNVVMSIHPPAMYTGLIGLAVPAAYLLAALWVRVPSREWTAVVRRWTLWAWMFCSAALVLGGMWAYMELGWGGYWEWDPVENAALLPWLTATAFLHALQMEERRGMFRWWTAILGVSSFLLTLVGTYITRSGVLKNSVHAFTGTGVGPYFLILMGAGFAYAVGVLWLRRDLLRDRIELGDTFSKESLYLLLNVFFTAIAAVVLVGTFYPVLSQALWGQTVVLSVHFFNRMTAPMFLALVLLLGLAPAVPWYNARLREAVRRQRWPWAAGLAAGALAWADGFRTGLAVGGVVVTVFALGSMVQEYARAAQARIRAGTRPWPRALWAAATQNRRRYGGYLAHIAFLIIVLGVIGSHTNNVTVTQTVQPGSWVSVADYRIRFNGLDVVTHPGYQTTEANLTVIQGSRQWTLAPGASFFPGTAQPVADVAILGGLNQDLYVVLEGWDPGGQIATLEVFVNPMVSWIWIGMYVLVAASLWAMSHRTGPAAEVVTAAEPRAPLAWRRAQPLLERGDQA
ncbi:MAG: cytochrome c biogenesis protein CcsA [Firmicutes bacterium]|nr:heme lyase CcmF/NrfE family subunit [Alicyclobacillaceae bacterium]MCL6497739.1 cytochrome c biogenesis protein CcsA [Bacillota bacterium]